jgi:hypothetical protein
MTPCTHRVHTNDRHGHVQRGNIDRVTLQTFNGYVTLVSPEFVHTCRFVLTLMCVAVMGVLNVKNSVGVDELSRHDVFGGL